MKTNVLEKELDELKKENVILKTELQSQLNNIKLVINKNNEKDINCNDLSISPNVIVNRNLESNSDFHVVSDNATAVSLYVPLNKERETPRKDYCNVVKGSLVVPVNARRP